MVGPESHEPEIDLRKFLDLSGSLLVVAGFDTTIRWLSPSYLRILGFEPSQVVGSPFTDFIHPKDLEEVLEHLQLVLAGETVSFFRGVNPIDFFTGTRWAPCGGRS